MKGLFCGSKASNNEEYKKVIKIRTKVTILIFLIGGITLLVSYLAKNVWGIAVNKHMISAYYGSGTGLTVVSVILWIKNKRILADDDKLKKSRLNNTDERILEISNKAFKTAGIALLIGLYCTGLIGGLFDPILFQVLFSLVSIFLLTYIIAYKAFEKRM